MCGLCYYSNSCLQVCSDEFLQNINTQSNNSDSSLKIPASSPTVASDSAISSNESGIDLKSSICYKWRCLRQFLTLVKQASSNVSIQIMQHLLRFVAQGSVMFKQELFYCFFLPLLRTIRDKIISPDLQQSNPALVSGSIVQYYLLAMPILLNSKSTHELFLNHGGLKQLCALAHQHSLRKCILQVFKVIIIQEGKVLKQKRKSHSNCIQEEGDLEDEDQSRSTVIDMFVDMVYNGHTDVKLIKERENLICTTYMLAQKNWKNKQMKKDTQLSYTDYRTLLEPTHLLHQAKNPEQVISESTAESSSTDEFSGFTFSPCGPRRSVHHMEEVVIPEDLEELGILVDLWHSCAQLVPQSEAFLDRFLVCAGPYRAYKVFLSVLNMICISELEIPERCNSSYASSNWTLVNCWLSLLQSTLLTCLICADLGVFWDKQVCILTQ